MSTGNMDFRAPRVFGDTESQAVVGGRYDYESMRSDLKGLELDEKTLGLRVSEFVAIFSKVPPAMLSDTAAKIVGFMRKLPEGQQREETVRDCTLQLA